MNNLSNDERKRIRIAYLLTSIKRTGPVQQTLYIIQGLDLGIFQPILITLYDEEPESRLTEYLSAVEDYYKVILKKTKIVAGKTEKLFAILNKIDPDIIHTVGVLPSFAIARGGGYKQIMTVRNDLFLDYRTKYGYFKGKLLEKLDLYSIRRAKMVVACSLSLTELYKRTLGIKMITIQNGIDTENHCPVSKKQKYNIRKKLGLPEDKTIFVYTGQLIERKNVGILLDVFNLEFTEEDNILLLILGAGPLLKRYCDKYQINKQIIFKGNVINVSEYLAAADCYVSASKSEGLPNGVMEALATGLPLLLSDIDPHRELASLRDDTVLFKYDSYSSLSHGFRYIYEKLKTDESPKYLDFHQLDKKEMSKKYQELYCLLYNSN